MIQTNQNITDLLELANLYPSPHNGQPIRLRQHDDHSFDLYFEKERGLQAADISLLFSFVSMGVFVEHMAASAEALGHGFRYELDLPEQEALHGSGVIKFGRCYLQWNEAKPDNLLMQALHFRQTSRKKYYEGVSPKLDQQLTELDIDRAMVLAKLSKAQTKQAIWLNQRAVFDDMFDEPVRQELDHWLRYSKHQKQVKCDGLSYDCMELNGSMMKYIVNHHTMLRWPGISSLLKQYYLRTMMDNSDAYYMLAPFATEQEAFTIGTVIMKIWREVAVEGYYLHPFGTIMSNHAAHQDFLKLARVTHESREHGYLVFIFRCGKSKPPHPSLRIPYNEHLVMGS